MGFSLEEEMQTPRIHVAPDPRRFNALTRLQADLNVQSLVILGPFAQALPSLKRLGTVVFQDRSDKSLIQTMCQFLPRHLEELVLSVQLAPAFFFWMLAFVQPFHCL